MFLNTRQVCPIPVITTTTDNSNKEQKLERNITVLKFDYAHISPVYKCSVSGSVSTCEKHYLFL